MSTVKLFWWQSTCINYLSPQYGSEVVCSLITINYVVWNTAVWWPMTLPLIWDRQTIFGDKTKAWNQGISYIRILLLISMTVAKTDFHSFSSTYPQTSLPYPHCWHPLPSWWHVLKHSSYQPWQHRVCCPFSWRVHAMPLNCLDPSLLSRAPPPSTVARKEGGGARLLLTFTASSVWASKCMALC